MVSVSFIKRPRAVVTVNGDELPGWVSIDTEENEFTAPDTFRVIFAMSGLPSDRSAKWWSKLDKADIEIKAGFATGAEASSDALAPMFTGIVDDIDFDWVERTIVASGRDLTARMIDVKTTEKFVNLTSSAIAAKVAAKYGLSTNITATTTKAGRYYKTDHVDLQRERTEWDLITWLAHEEGFSTFVRGATLYFGPRPSLDDEIKFIIRRSEGTSERTEEGNYETLRTSRSLTVANDLKVTVKSWNAKQKKAFVKSATSGGGDRQEYTYTIPGLTPDQAQKKARAILQDLSRHARRITYGSNGRLDLHIGDVVLLEGTGTEFDTVYIPEVIRRTITPDEGFSMEFDAKNRLPEDGAPL